MAARWGKKGNRNLSPVSGLSLPFFVALFIASGKGSLWNPVAWPNISFRASEVNSGTHITLSSQRQFMKSFGAKECFILAAGCG